MHIIDYADNTQSRITDIHFFDKTTTPREGSVYTHTFCGKRTIDVKIAKHIKRLFETNKDFICAFCAAVRPDIQLYILANTEL